MNVTIRELTTTAELDALLDLFDTVWQPEPGTRTMTFDVVRALSHAGNYVVGAYVDDDLVGGCAAFFGPPAARTLHSHITGVAERGRGSDLGYLIKRHQRDWARARGVEQITWTFDPLVARNAYFNLTKLGATPVEYLPDFYGTLADGLNGDDRTDRMLVSWHVEAPAPSPPPDPGPPGEWAITEPDPGHPQARPVDAPVLLVPIPRDIESLRRTDPDAAARWRAATRTALSDALAKPGRRITFHRSGCYIVGSAQR